MTDIEHSDGLNAVSIKHGAAVKQRMLNWPRIAEHLTRAWTDAQDVIDTAVSEARKALTRAAADPDWALEQGAMIRRAGVADDDIPSAALMRKAQAEADAKGRRNLQAWATDRDREREATGEPASESDRNHALARRILEESGPMPEPVRADVEESA